jgi:hypothetical protein
VIYKVTIQALLSSTINGRTIMAKGGGGPERRKRMFVWFHKYGEKGGRE